MSKQVTSDYIYLNSPFKHQPFFQMQQLNDGRSLLESLYDAVEDADPSCINPEIDGRIQDLPFP